MPKDQTPPEIVLKVPAEHLGEWLQNRVTRQVLEFLKELQQSLEIQLTTGVTLSLTNSDQTAQSTALLVGEIQGLNHILKIQPELEDYIDELKGDSDDQTGRA